MQDTIPTHKSNRCGWYSQERAAVGGVALYSTPDGGQVAVTAMADCSLLDDPERSQWLGEYRGPVVKWLRTIDAPPMLSGSARAGPGVPMQRGSPTVYNTAGVLAPGAGQRYGREPASTFASALPQAGGIYGAGTPARPEERASPVRLSGGAIRPDTAHQPSDDTSTSTPPHVTTRRLFGPLARASARRPDLCGSGLQSPHYRIVVSTSFGGAVHVAMTRDGKAIVYPNPSLGLVADVALLPKALRVRRGTSRLEDLGPLNEIMQAAGDAVLRGQPWRMGLRPVAASDVPEVAPAPVPGGPPVRRYYALDFDECDAALLLSLARSRMERSAQSALYPPRTLVQASAARATEDAPYGVDVLSGGVLPADLEEIIAPYVLYRACAAADQPPDVQGLTNAAAYVGLDADDPIYRSSPIALCTDAWTAIDNRAQRRAPVERDALPRRDSQEATSEPPRSRQRLL
ncbi:hypothetical protein pclt_cds_691 [Pandoravirus celtis]|uniref:DUF5897 domain-containing protein n=1 Tax=Pandoravirus celtis TaxID=2568002 RepID=A0A4D6EIE2_9VIRU|nr:hypothetical protein pclt_cds_691 [Pandoravirus celtis]